MYNTVIRPIFTYCCSIWISAINTDINRKKLRRIQALALRIMKGAMPSTPFDSLSHLTNSTDIIIFLQGEAAKGAARLQAYESWSLETIPHKAPCKGTIKAHININNEFMADLNIPPPLRTSLSPR
jgi:hypothetical protein